GKDRVQIQTADDAAAIDELGRDFGIEASMHEGAVTFSVAGGEEFVPRLFAGLSGPIRAVGVARPPLDDVVMTYTGKTIRDAEATGADAMRQIAAHWRGRREIMAKQNTPAGRGGGEAAPAGQIRGGGSRPNPPPGPRRQQHLWPRGPGQGPPRPPP